MNICWLGFKTFFKIGLFTFGGGYAMISMIQHEIVDKQKWLTEEEFMDFQALSQALPGIFAVNMSAYIGHKLKGWLGALMFSLGVVLPSFLIILLVALCFQNYSQWHWLESIMKGIRPAVVALIAVPCVKLCKSAGVTMKTVWIPISVAALICLAGISPVWIIVVVVCGTYAFGVLSGMMDNEKEGK